MKKVACKACGEGIYSTETICPKCGEVQVRGEHAETKSVKLMSRQVPLWTVAIPTALLLATLVVVAVGKKRVTKERITSAPTQQTTADAQSSAPAPPPRADSSRANLSGKYIHKESFEGSDLVDYLDLSMDGKGRQYNGYVEIVFDWTSEGDSLFLRNWVQTKNPSPPLTNSRLTGKTIVAEVVGGGKYIQLNCTPAGLEGVTLWEKLE